MIEAGVASFLEGRVMVLIATRNAAHRPMIGRATGARFDADSGRITLLVSSSQWPDAVAHALPGSPISATFVQPDTYEAYQIKGLISELRPANAIEQARGTRYVEDMLATMGALGVTRLQLSSTLSDRELVRISFTPRDLFVQTPGPKAGSRLGIAEAVAS
ncbi:hypothetical protein [Rhizobium sp. RU36D]|uniref:hypothetical protein n=1 Tax=Rhizobium sp. RU36D TaxID=1907415 RepID=UPI0009D82C76|nr:hypothetical protein [Rhizobium sp. RU36D]SMC96694.1 hypothetical protein SAMN05880593_11296 [Rhizobium sp. RU36D]